MQKMTHFRLKSDIPGYYIGDMSNYIDTTSGHKRT